MEPLYLDSPYKETSVYTVEPLYLDSPYKENSVSNDAIYGILESLPIWTFSMVPMCPTTIPLPLAMAAFALSQIPLKCFGKRACLVFAGICSPPDCVAAAS